ncbi:antibiotic synthesis protein MbtH [Streptomyces eurocidicus]|uniref:Antibiotic synthesis protein MbtH n=1 Tax=Streptomyces eurocidicus TaxID=66423 RepID=A0A2N8NVU5_STREU|nr:MbtH family protein [Streptomyces eurocidicus]MBB5123149.1 MbtH protein [Streptomyces eurocidicus]MBF6056662.1 MbtH family NRPS accessory protein [Streptomyces eurocidicus]PNE32842.1 antibiotic synthesis protein MbtH [Streptomyces eurocidicus]
MTTAEEADSTVCSVVVNDEEQYSIWPAGNPVPAGWRPTGFQGGKAECLAHVAGIWLDMRPLSLRRTSADAA